MAQKSLDSFKQFRANWKDATQAASSSDPNESAAGKEYISTINNYVANQNQNTYDLSNKKLGRPASSRGYQVSQQKGNTQAEKNNNYRNYLAESATANGGTTNPTKPKTGQSAVGAKGINLGAAMNTALHREPEHIEGYDEIWQYYVDHGFNPVGIDDETLKNYYDYAIQLSKTHSDDYIKTVLARSGAGAVLTPPAGDPKEELETLQEEEEQKGHNQNGSVMVGAQYDDYQRAMLAQLLGKDVSEITSADLATYIDPNGQWKDTTDLALDTKNEPVSSAQAQTQMPTTKDISPDIPNLGSVNLPTDEAGYNELLAQYQKDNPTGRYNPAAADSSMVSGNPDIINAYMAQLKDSGRNINPEEMDRLTTDKAGNIRVTGTPLMGDNQSAVGRIAGGVGNAASGMDEFASQVATSRGNAPKSATEWANAKIIFDEYDDMELGLAANILGENINDIKAGKVSPAEIDEALQQIGLR